MPGEKKLRSPRVALLKAASARPVRSDSGRYLFTDDPAKAKACLRNLGITQFIQILVYEMTERAVPILVFQITNDNMMASSLILANISAFSNLLGFLLNPLLGGISDTYGRKACLLMYPLTKALSSAALVVWPSVPSLYFNAGMRLLSLS